MISVSDDEIFYEAASLRDLQSIFKKYPPTIHVGGWMYRGQADLDWKLSPKAGREGFSSVGREADIAQLSIWLDKAVAYGPLPDDFLECMAIAQHHGLATRLLDWSNNPLVSTYFACRDVPDKDAALYLYLPTSNIDTEVTNWRKVDHVAGFVPKTTAARIGSQSARFTYHPDPRESIEFMKLEHPFSGQQLKKVIIPKESKVDILNELDIYNINDHSIFPDLDGLSSYMNWKMSITNRNA